MSSYVIDKKEYIKAAGFIAGLTENFSVRDFWLYDFSVGRNMTKEDYHRQFSAFYNMNAASVKEQYNDSVCESDENDYMDIFNEYRKKGRQMYLADVKSALIDLIDFFDSVCYQVEDDEYNKYMRAFFDRVVVEAFSKIHPHECKCWGDFNLDKKDEEELVPLF